MDDLKNLEYEDADNNSSIEEKMEIEEITELSRQLRTFFNLKSA